MRLLVVVPVVLVLLLIALSTVSAEPQLVSLLRRLVESNTLMVSLVG
jgi:hypothetical protein